MHWRTYSSTFEYSRKKE